MDCNQAREWLLTAERPWDVGTQPADVASHIPRCAECARMASRLQRLEAAWRERPSASGSESDAEAFLANLPTAAPTEPVGSRKLPSFRWAIAASLLAAIGIGGGLFWFPQTVRADDEVMEELVDLNLELASTPALAERRVANAEKTKRLKARVQSAKLSKAQRQLANSLLESADWLLDHADPVETAGQFHSLRDRLLVQLRDANDAGDVPAMRRLLRQYNKISEEGFAAYLEKAEASPVLDFRNQGKLEKMALRDREHMKALAELLEKSPNATRKEIKRVLDRSAQREKKRKKGASIPND